MKFIITTYLDENNKYPEHLYGTIDKWKDKGINLQIYNGVFYKSIGAKTFQICYINFLNMLKENIGNDIFFIEDDIIPTDKFDVNKLEINDRDCVYRLGYNKIRSNGHIIGTNCIIIPKEMIECIINKMEQRRKQHIDYFLSLNIKNKIYKSNDLTIEIPHYSHIISSLRDGNY